MCEMLPKLLGFLQYNEEIVSDYHTWMSVTRNQELKVSGSPNSVTDHTQYIK